MKGSNAALHANDQRIGALIGRIAGPFLVLQAIAPFVLALVAEHGSDRAALTVVAALALSAFTCFVMLQRPK